VPPQVLLVLLVMRLLHKKSASGAQYCGSRLYVKHAMVLLLLPAALLLMSSFLPLNLD
jgi:hypothetical protein